MMDIICRSAYMQMLEYMYVSLLVLNNVIYSVAFFTEIEKLDHDLVC